MLVQVFVQVTLHRIGEDGHSRGILQGVRTVVETLTLLLPQLHDGRFQEGAHRNGKKKQDEMVGDERKKFDAPHVLVDTMMLRTGRH